MAAPTNTTPATAVDLGTLPNSIDQNVHDAGTTYEVYYKYTAVVGDVELGVWARDQNSLTPYSPWTRIYDDIGLTNQLVFSTNSKRVQVPVTPGTTYYIRITPNSPTANPADLRISALIAPDDAVMNGDIFVNDDTDGYPLVILTPTDYTVRKFVHPIVAGEGGDILDNGKFMYNNSDDGHVIIYDTDFSEIIDITFDDFVDVAIRTCIGTQRFWVGAEQGAGDVLVRSYDDAGNPSALHTLTGTTRIDCLAANNDETILYHARTSTGTKAIKAWDLPGVSALSDLAAEISGYITQDILVLKDNTILVSYIKQSATIDVNVKRYNAAGTVLNTYNFGSAHTFPFGTLPRLAYGVDNETTFWIWTHPTPSTAGLSVFQEIRVSDGAVLQTITHQEYELGVYNASATLTPTTEFGNSFSCPFFIARGYTEEGTIVVGKMSNPFSGTEDFDFEIDGGAIASFSLQSDDAGFTIDVPPGTYSIVELPNGFWLPTYLVSNDSVNNDNLAVVVGAGEVVTVVVLNQLRVTGGGIFDLPLPLGDNTTLTDGSSNPNYPLPGKPNDDFPEQDGTIIQVKIPDPFFITAFFGDK